MLTPVPPDRTLPCYVVPVEGLTMDYCIYAVLMVSHVAVISLVLSRPYLSNGRAYCMVVVRLSSVVVCLAVRNRCIVAKR